MNRPIVFAVSAHGFGHLGQCVPVIEALRRRFPGIPVTVVCSHSGERVAEFMPADISIAAAPSHVMIAMRDALTVDTSTTRQNFLDWHRDYDQRVAEFVNCLNALQPRLVVTNVDYSWISAARSLSLPVIGFCSLNWADILEGIYPETDHAMREVTEQIRRVYNTANRFLRVSPGMGMPGLHNLASVEVLARRGQAVDLRHYVSDSKVQRFVLLSLGGVAQDIDLSGWDIPVDTQLIVPDTLAVAHPRICAISSLGLDHIDVLASVDVLLTKPGYGSFCEAWRNQTALVYLRRNLWPEETVLIDWIQRHVPAQEMSREEFTKGALGSVLDRLAARPATFHQLETGENAVINHISQWLSESQFEGSSA